MAGIMSNDELQILMLTRINEPGFMTHMPFLAQATDSTAVLFFCRATEAQADGTRIWKAGYLDAAGQPRRLATGMAPDVIECSPTAWQDSSGWHVSFIAGGTTDSPSFHLYRMDGPTLEDLSPPVALQRTRTGFVYRDRIAWGELEDIVHLRDSTGDRIIEVPGAFIYRVAYCADLPDTLLISGQWKKEDDVFTLQYELATGNQHFIECDGRPAYKCTILGGEILYADLTGSHFEERTVRKAVSIVKRPAWIAAMRSVDANATEAGTGGCGCRGSIAPPPTTPTRASCLECVEKHIGAAYVLLSESNDGYAHRLRAVGHLHEAEDESQEWTKLHNAVRQARKAYQTENTMPNWRRLDRLIGEVRSRVE